MSQPILRSDLQQQRQVAVRAPPPAPANRPVRRIATWIIVVIIIVVLLVVAAIAFAVWWFFIRKSSTSSSSGNTTQPSCRTSTDCDTFFGCVDNRCQGFSGASCTSDAQCAPEFSCSGSSTSGKVCTQRSCTQDSDCNVGGTSGLKCDTTRSLCVGPSGTPCESSGDCISPFVCRLSTQKCGGDIGNPCNTTEDCISPFECLNGTCQVQSCNSPADCKANNATCYGGKCSIIAGGECVLAEQCQGGTTTCSANFADSSKLGFNACLLYSNQTCDSSKQFQCLFECNGTPTTLNNTCVCNSDADCAPGTTCQNPGIFGQCA